MQSDSADQILIRKHLPVRSSGQHVFGYDSGQPPGLVAEVVMMTQRARDKADGAEQSMQQQQQGLIDTPSNFSSVCCSSSSSRSIGVWASRGSSSKIAEDARVSYSASAVLLQQQQTAPALDRAGAANQHSQSLL